MGTLSWDQAWILLILPGIFSKGFPLFFAIGKRMNPLLGYLRSVLTFTGRGNLQQSICSHLGIDILLSSLRNRSKRCAWRGSSPFYKHPAFPCLLICYNEG